LSPAWRAIESVYVPAATVIVSVPAVLFALRIASRRLQDEEVSALLTLLHVLATAPGAGSSVRFTKKVGSGSGIMTEGAVSPECIAIIPGRPSIFTRAEMAATGEPL